MTTTWSHQYEISYICEWCHMLQTTVTILPPNMYERKTTGAINGSVSGATIRHNPSKRSVNEKDHQIKNRHLIIWCQNRLKQLHIPDRRVCNASRSVQLTEQPRYGHGYCSLYGFAFPSVQSNRRWQAESRGLHSMHDCLHCMQVCWSMSDTKAFIVPLTSKRPVPV